VSGKGPRRFLSEMDDVERRYTLAIHDVYCHEKPVGHTAMAHEPFDGVDDPDELVPWRTVVAALASHGLVLASVGAGHRTSEPHDCFLMNCATLGEEVAALQGRAAALSGSTAPLDRDALIEQLAPVVMDWFDTGYENGKLDTGVLTRRIVAVLSAAASPDPARPDRAAGEGGG
jgi:hypothetical protein